MLYIQSGDRVVISVNNIVQLKSEDLIGINFQCSCGRVHEVGIRQVKIGNEVIGDLIRSLAPFQGKKILLVADRNTYEISGKNVEFYCK